MAAPRESLIDSFKRFRKKRRLENAPVAFSDDWKPREVLACRFQLRGMAQERPRLGNVSDCEVLVDFEDFRKTQATWQPLSDVVDITGLSSKCERCIALFVACFA